MKFEDRNIENKVQYEQSCYQNTREMQHKNVRVVISGFQTQFIFFLNLNFLLSPY